MRALIVSLAMIMVLTSILANPADARRRKKGRKGKKAKSALKATAETKKAIEGLMGKFKWGMTSEKALALLEGKIREQYVPLIQKERDPLRQDRMRREMMAKIKEMRKNYVKFEGGRTPWDVSLVDKEFDHKNSESMAFLWGKKDRRFYFFHHGKLWKVYIAFNAALFKGKTFEDFANVMEKRFGSAERKYTTTILGDPKLDHLAWPAVENTLLKAKDTTGFYGNFCLVLSDALVSETVKAGRELNSPKKGGSDALVDSATTATGSVSDENEDIVDQITGKGTEEPTVGVRDSGKPKIPSGPVDTTSDSDIDVAPKAPKKKKRRKINTSNPLEDLDI